MLSSVPRFPTASSHPFPGAVRQAVDGYFAQAGISPYADWRLWTKAALLLCGTVTTWVIVVFVPLPGAVALALAALLGGLVATVGMAVGHDALHGSFSPRPWVNRLVGHSFDLIGANSYIWRHTHNGTHHIFTNVEGVDLDLDIGLIAVSPLAPRNRAHRWQHLYAPLLYSLATVHWLLIKDVHYFMLRRMGTRTELRHPPRAWAGLIGGKIFALSTQLVIPLVVAPYPWWGVLAGFLTAHLVAGLFMGTVFQLAHQVASVDFPRIAANDERPTLPWPFLVHQLHTTTNFGCENRLLSWFVGGLNFQVEHHLFPRVASVHYPALREIVHKLAARYDLPYNEYPSFTSAIRAHLSWLRKQGQQPAAESAPIASGDDAFLDSLRPYNRAPSADEVLVDGRVMRYPAVHRGGSTALSQARAAFDARPLVESYHLNTPHALRRAVEGEAPAAEPNAPVSPFTFEDDDLYRSIKRRVRQWQKQEGLRDFYAPRTYLGIWGMHVVAILASNALAWWYGLNGALLFTCIFAGTASTLRALMLLREAHSATHYCVTANARLNAIIAQISWGIISVQCADRLNATHVETHHLYTSTWRVDNTAFPGIRTSRREPYRPWNRFQVGYTIPIYSLILLLTPLQEWWCLVTQRRYEGRRFVNLVFSIGFAVFYYGGALATGNFLWLLAAVCPASLILAAAFAVNHQVDPCVDVADRYALDEMLLQRKKAVDFGRYQAEVTPNHSENSWIMNQLLGGLNHHRTHHLLPKVHYHYYPALTRIVNKVLREHRVPTPTYPTFRSALHAHYRLLKMRSIPD